MKALLLIAHGSRRESSNQEVIELAERLKKSSSRQFPIIETAFLEIVEPSIAHGVDRCVAQGASQIRVVPYFLVAGRHVCDDVPNLVTAAAKQHSGLSVSISAHIGSSSRVLKIIEECAMVAD